MELLNKIGENALIAFLAVLLTIFLVAWILPEKSGEITISLITLFSMLLGRKKSQENG